MSYLTREDGSREELFGSGGGEALAAEVEAPLLGRIPFDPRLGALADEGEPIVLAEPEAEVSRAIVALRRGHRRHEARAGIGIVKPLPLVRGLTHRGRRRPPAGARFR